jgi:hypothetical protein
VSSYLLSGTHKYILSLLLPRLLALPTSHPAPFQLEVLKVEPEAGKMKKLTEMYYVPTKQQLKERCTSVKAWELPKQKSALAPPHIWTNEDMDPVKIENQTWTLWTWMAYWATDTINLGTWETASSILSVGLSWREAIPIVSSQFLNYERMAANNFRSWWAHPVLLSLWFSTVLLVQNSTFHSRSPFELLSDTTWPTSVSFLDRFLPCSGSVFKVQMVHNVLPSCSPLSGHPTQTSRIQSIWRSKVLIPRGWLGMTSGRFQTINQLTCLQLLLVLDHPIATSLDPPNQTPLLVRSQVDCRTNNCPRNHGMVRAQGRRKRTDFRTQGYSLRQHQSLPLAQLHVLSHWFLVYARL